MTTFRRLSASEMREFLSSRGTKVSRQHAMTKRVCHWSVCAHCGLLNLKNDATRKALKQQCVTEE